MTKKHYEAIAKVINEAYTAESDLGIIKDIAFPLADYFAADNPRFDRDRFLTACGIEIEKPINSDEWRSGMNGGPGYCPFCESEEVVYNQYVNRGLYICQECGKTSQT